MIYIILTKLKTADEQAKIILLDQLSSQLSD